MHFYWAEARHLVDLVPIAWPNSGKAEFGPTALLMPRMVQYATRWAKGAHRSILRVRRAIQMCRAGPPLSLGPGFAVSQDSKGSSESDRVFELGVPGPWGLWGLLGGPQIESGILWHQSGSGEGRF